MSSVWIPRLYDRLLEPIVGGFRRAGMQVAPAGPDRRVLDVGCGTGSHLALYAAGGAEIVGVDRSPHMLARAAGKLGPRARLLEADATALPFPDAAFDLTIAMTLLHELGDEQRRQALVEMRRVTAPGSGRLLVIDHHPETVPDLRSRLARSFATAVERMAGGDHYRNYLQFRAAGGVPALARSAGLRVEHRLLEGSGTIGVYVIV